MKRKAGAGRAAAEDSGGSELKTAGGPVTQPQGPLASSSAGGRQPLRMHVANGLETACLEFCQL